MASSSEQQVPLTSSESRAEDAGCDGLEEGLEDQLPSQVNWRQERTPAQRLGAVASTAAVCVAMVLGVTVVVHAVGAPSPWQTSSKGTGANGMLAEVKDDCAACSDEYSKTSGVLADPTMLGGAMTYEDVQKALHTSCPEHCTKKKSASSDVFMGFGGLSGEDDWGTVSGSDTDGGDADEELEDDGTPCHTCESGEMCYDLVTYTVRKLLTNADFYPGLTPKSTEAQVQSRLHRDRPGICSRPCAKGEKEGNTKGGVKKHTAAAKQAQVAHDDVECQTAVPGDDCFGTIVWVLSEGVFQHPKWFQGLNQASSPEAVQRHLKRNPQKGMPPLCAEPCEEKCHNAVEGEPCYDGVTWAMEEGIANHSDWFPGLNVKSSFAEVQLHVHNNPNATVYCPKPCEVCHTAVKGERCYSAVVWVMEEGLRTKPDCYEGLNAFSSFQEVQDHLHRNKTESASHCVKPCPVAQDIEPAEVDLEA